MGVLGDAEGKGSISTKSSKIKTTSRLLKSQKNSALSTVTLTLKALRRALQF